MIQHELFLKDCGKEMAARPHEAELRAAQALAVKIATIKEEVTIDDVREAMPGHEFGNWAGSVFKGPQWIACGVEPARHEGSHARLIRKWKLR